MLERLLTSLAEIAVPANSTLELRVVDNDADESAREIVHRLESRAHPFNRVSYSVEPRQNIALARNGAIDAGEADLIAFVDDDEVVSPDWLVQMVDALDTSVADAAFGPVDGRLPAGSPLWLHRCRLFHHGVTTQGNGKLPWQSTRTGNTLVKGKWFYVDRLRFRESFGRSGGSDTELFTRIHQSGGRFAAAPDAVVWEDVPAERATFRWLWNRRYRGGLVYHRICTENGIRMNPPVQFGRRIVKSAMLLICGLPGCLTGRVETFMLGLLTLPLAWGGLMAWLRPAGSGRFAEYKGATDQDKHSTTPVNRDAA